MKVKPPCWLRICWGGNVGWPDEEDYPVTPSDHPFRGRSFPIKRQKNAVPDRWIYDLFLSNFTKQEIAQRCGISPEYVRQRFYQLERAGVITHKQRLQWQSSVVRHRRNRRYLPRRVRDPDKYRYVIRVFKQTQITIETSRRTGVPLSTVSRWVGKYLRDISQRQDAA